MTPTGSDPVRVGVTRCRRFFAALLEVSFTVTSVDPDEPRSIERVVGDAVAPSPMVAEATPASWRFARLTHEARAARGGAPDEEDADHDGEEKGPRRHEQVRVAGQLWLMVNAAAGSVAFLFWSTWLAVLAGRV